MRYLNGTLITILWAAFWIYAAKFWIQFEDRKLSSGCYQC
jgi:hypothetical protein